MSKCSTQDAAYTSAAAASTAADQCDQTVMNALYSDFVCSRSAFKSVNPNYDSPNSMLRFCKNSRAILLHDPGTPVCVDQQAAYASVYAMYPANGGCDQRECTLMHRKRQALYDYYRCNIYEFVSLSSNYDGANSMLRYCSSLGISLADPSNPGSGSASPTAAPNPPIASTATVAPPVSASVPVDPENSDPENSQAVPTLTSTSQNGAASNASPNNPAPVTSIPGGGGVGNPANPTNKPTTSSIPTASNTSNTTSNSDTGTPMGLILGASLGGLAVLAVMIGIGREKTDSWRITPTETWTVDQVAAWAAFELRDVEQEFLDKIRGE
ncbi:hypothetical protein HDU81_005318 [Chytriomyces hyalinus]|nr:hypothetical protein HDU81_005318 [Chytriomyces hyalinus]